MTTIITAGGREVPASLVSAGRIFPVLMIYSPADPAELQEIFSDPAETAVLTERREDGTETVYRDFTQLFSIGPSSAATGEPETLVWLNYVEPPEEEDEK